MALMVAAIKPDDFYNSNNFDSMISPLNKKKFEVFSDPSHSWIKVKKTFLTYLIGDDWRKHFTSFSYERADFVYLEEDDDAATGNRPMGTNGSEGAEAVWAMAWPLAPVLPQEWGAVDDDLLLASSFHAKVAAAPKRIVIAIVLAIARFPHIILFFNAGL